MAIKIGAKLYTDKLKFCFDFANPKCVYPIGSYGTEAIDLNGITTGDGYRNPVQLSNQVGYTSGSNLHFNGEYVYDFPTDTVHANPRFVHERGAPGIRFDNSKNDQKRTMTPKQAYNNGSDWLVIGRSLTKGNIKNNIKNLIDHLS